MEKKWFPVWLITGLALNAIGLFNDILEPDGALYATIAKHIATTHDWINLVGDGHDWLDKPHLPFWLTAASYRIFGINSFAYKFPAYVCWLAGVYYTYRLAAILFTRDIARISVLIYICSLHAFISNFDVRAEAYLTAFTTGAIYHLLRLYRGEGGWHMVAGALLAAFAVMTKGIFVLFTIGGGFLLYWAVTGRWKELLQPKWWLVVLLVLVFITPELYCLYRQFDLHPEKIVFGRTGVSGLRFFFWDSQFGRFFNTGPIKGSGDPFFFLHTIIWAFLPWSVILYIYVARLLLRRQRMPGPETWIVAGSAALGFLLFSFSGFQLPHYIIILFPQFSILCALYLHALFTQQHMGGKKLIQTLQVVILVAGVVLVAGIAYYCQCPAALAWTVAAFLAGGAVVLGCRRVSLHNTLVHGFVFALIVYSFLNFSFYRMLLPYQSGMQAARWLKEQHISGPLGMYKEFSYSLEFYGDAAAVQRLYRPEQARSFAFAPGAMLYADTRELDSLRQAGLRVEVLKTFAFFRVSMLNAQFLYPATRPYAASTMMLAKVYADGPAALQQ